MLGDVFWVEGLLSTIYDVFLDQIIDGQIYTKAAGERDPAREHWTRLQELNLADNALLIFDRGYYSKELYEDLVSNGCNVLMRLRKDNKFCKRVCLVYLFLYQVHQFFFNLNSILARSKNILQYF